MVDPMTRSPLHPQAREKFRELFVDQATGSYLLLSFGMGAVASLLPILLVIAGGYVGHYSISVFYHANGVSRDLLVGCLWATGVFMFLFHGLSKLENWVLNAAGVFGISVAMNPMEMPQCGGPNSGISLHALSAILFFVCLAFVAVFLSKGRIRYIQDPKIRRRFKGAYYLAGAAMVAMPGIVAALHFLSRRGCESHWVFWVETLGIWAFAFFWFVKTLEYRMLLGVTWHVPSVPVREL